MGFLITNKQLGTLQLQKDSLRHYPDSKLALWVLIREDLVDVKMHFSETIEQAALKYEDFQYEWGHLLDDVRSISWGSQAPQSYISIYDDL